MGTEAGWTNALFIYRVRGSGFLHHMVRNLVGTMLDVGRGYRRPARNSRHDRRPRPQRRRAYRPCPRTLPAFGRISAPRPSSHRSSGNRDPISKPDKAWLTLPATLKSFGMPTAARISAFSRVTALAGKRPVMPLLPGSTGIPRTSWTGRRRWWRFPRRPSANRPGRMDCRHALPRPGSQTSKPTKSETSLGFCIRLAIIPKAPGTMVVVSAHLDTVFPAETPINPRVTEKDGTERLEAPGACDNGAGIAGLLAVAHALIHAEADLAAPLLFVGNVGEEGEGDLRGIRHLYAAAPSPAASPPTSFLTARARTRPSLRRWEAAASRSDSADPAATALPMPAPPTPSPPWPWRWPLWLEPPSPTSPGPL